MIENQLLLRVPWLMRRRGGDRGEGDGGNKSCCPIQNVLEATLKTAASRTIAVAKLYWKRALVTQIMSPALTGKLMAEKNGEWARQGQVFFLFKFPLFYWRLSG